MIAPGTLCVVVDHPVLTSYRHLLGRECVAVRLLTPEECWKSRAEPSFGPFYCVEFPGIPEPMVASHLVLRPKRPPAELSSWDAIEKLTKWNPLKQEQPVCPSP